VKGSRGRGGGSGQGGSLYAKRPKRLCGSRSTGVQQLRLAVRVRTVESVGKADEDEGAERDTLVLLSSSGAAAGSNSTAWINQQASRKRTSTSIGYQKA
jgi:hypothetical protein